MVRRYLSMGLASASLAMAIACSVLAPATPAFGQGITQKVAVCNPAYVGRCIAPDANGAVPVTVSGTTGTSDVNLKQVNGATINVGVGAAGTGTQRVTTSTDSTIGTVTAVTAITNPLPAGSNIVGNVRVDQTTPGTTNGVVVNTSALPTGAATSALQTTGNTTLTTINTTLGTPFQASGSIGNTTFAATQATASSLNAQVQGVDAKGASSTARPVLGGGVYTASPTTVTDGQRTNVETSAYGEARSLLVGSQSAGSSGLTNLVARVFSQGSQTTSLPLAVNGTAYNGSTMDQIVTIQGASAGSGIGVLATSYTPSVSANASTLDTHCTAACASIIVATGTHNLYGLGFSSTATGWLLIYDATSCSGNGTVTPYRAYAYPTANVTTTVSWADVPTKNFATGIAACFSTTGPYTATASTTAMIWLDYR